MRRNAHSKDSSVEFCCSYDPLEPRAVWVDETHRRGLLTQAGHTMESITLEKEHLDLIRNRCAEFFD